LPEITGAKVQRVLLGNNVPEKWDEIPQEKITHLIDSMPRRVSAE